MKKALFIIGLALTLLFFGVVICFAQNKPISALPVATTPLAGTELIPIVQNGITKQTTIGAVSGLAPCCTIVNGDPLGNANLYLGNPIPFTGVVGTNNSVTGFGSGGGLTAGSYNTVNGNGSFVANNIGSSNTILGAGSATLNTGGSFNTVTGAAAFSTNVTGSYLTAVGAQTDVASSGLSNSIALGYGAVVTQSDQMVVGSTSMPVSNWVINNVPYVMPATQGATNTVLTNNGSGTLTWSTPSGTGTVTSITAGTGLTGGTITSSGAIALSSPVAVANDGTGQTSVSAAINALLPSQSGNSGEYLTTNGTSASWSAVSASAALTSTYIGYGNGSSLLTGDADFIRTSFGIELVDNPSYNDIYIGAPGYNAGNNTSTGGGNIGLGVVALSSNSSGYSNIAIGGNSLTHNTSGNSNIAIGAGSLANNTTGYHNIVISSNSGLTSNITGNNLIGIGIGVNVSTDGLGNSVALGTGATITGSNQFVVAPTIVNWNIGGVGYVVPSSQGAANTFLKNDGSGNLSWVTPSGAGTVTSITAGTGLTGGTITGSGTIALSSPVTIANGGTGQTTASAAINALLPSQSGNSGEYLTTNGTSASWGTVSGGTPSLTSTYIGYGNGSNVLTGNSLFTYNTANGSMGLWAGTGNVLINCTTTGITGSGNVGIGAYGGNQFASLSSGGDNVSLGPALVGVSSGSDNIGIGFASGSGVTTGTGNIAIGSECLSSLGGGDYNIALGVKASFGITSGNYGIAIGANTTTVSNSNCVVIGGGSSTTGRSNTTSNQMYFADNLVNWSIAGVPYVMPSSQGAANTYLKNDGSGNLSWVTPSGSGTVTSIIAGTGLTGGTITSSGTIALSSPVAVANGGTGQTTASAAINALLPSQSGNSGEYLTTNGTSASWGAVSGGTPSLTSTYIGYGDGSNLLTGDANFKRNPYGIGLQDDITKLNIFIGTPNYPSGNGSSTSSENIGIGINTLISLTTAVNNIAIGTACLHFNLSGNYLIGIGTAVDVSTDGLSNSIGLGNGNNFKITASNQFIVDPTIVNWNIGGVPYVLPSSQGGASTVLTNDGSGNLSWSGTTQNIQLLGKLTGADLNTTANADQPITLSGGTHYIITNIVYTNVSADLTSTGVLQTQINTGPSQSGNYIEYENEFVAFLSSSDQFMDWNVANTAVEFEHIQPYVWMGVSSPFLGHLVTSPVYFSDLVPAGLTATCDIYVYGYVLN